MMALKNKIKILYIMPALALGGAERFLTDLIIGLNKDKFSPALLLFKDKGPLLAEIAAENIPIFCLNKTRLLDVKNFYQILSVIKKFQPDIVHTLLGGDLYGRLAAALAGVAVVISTEQNVNPDEKKYTQIIKRLTGLKADYIVAISRAVKADSKKRYAYPEDKIRLIPNGINIKKFIHPLADEHQNADQNRSQTKSKLMFGTIGRLAPQKGQATLIAAWSLLKNKDAKCLIAGSGPLAENLQQQINESGLSERIKLVGPVEPSSFLKSLDFFLLPSLWEGQGIVLLEAGLSGLPILASAVDGITELINEDTGWLAPAGQTQAWAEKIDFLIDHQDSPQLKEKTRRLKNIIMNDYSLDKNVSAYENLYLTALAAKNKAALMQ